MYLQHELREVAEHRQTEALKRIHWLHSLMQHHHGFIRTLACRYPGNVNQYAWLRMWDSSEQQTAFRQSPGAREFASTRPEGLYGPLPGGVAAGTNWQSVIENGAGDLGSYVVRCAFEVAGDRQAEFLDNRRRYDEIALRTPGVESVLTFRSVDAGSENVYLSLMRARDRDAINRLLESASAASYREAPADALYKLLTTECYEIVEELTPV